LNKVRIICRQSRLSLLQAEMVKEKILAVQPAAEVEIIGRSSRGDRELSVPLSSLDGTDFFTEEIFEALLNNEADIAVHSLKDMSTPHFFSHEAFAIVDRDDTRDVVIFNPDIEEKIKAGETIIIGTCSPRREEMAIGFLKKALPQLSSEIRIEVKSIRGNVESRLKQLDEKKYDGTILATAGLNRLLKPHLNPPPRGGLVETPITENKLSNQAIIQQLLSDKKLMLLPLIECVPAPCQGAIVAEAHPDNTDAVELLKKINNKVLFEEAYKEKQEAWKYGTGCLQKFGVTTLHTANGNILYAAGEDTNGKAFQHWHGLPDLNIDEEQLFSSTDFMKDFFEYEWFEENIDIEQKVIFIANYKSVQNCSIDLLQQKSATQQTLNSSKTADNQKIIFASGTRTWFELSKLGYWVTGSADALGVESFLPSLQMPLFNITLDDVCILTHKEAAERWKEKGYHAVSNYQLVSKKNDAVTSAIAEADYLFWSSFSQYNYYKQYIKPGAAHLCAGGETAALLKQAGEEPVIFPTIKAFEQWRKTFIRSHSVA
jgi:hydroxymethylbilane synthase